MPERNRVQAMIPRGAKMIFNTAGTAAGIDVTSSVLPGAANWPKALYDPEPSGCKTCEASVQQHFREFFSATTPPPVAPRPS